jgi:DNA/RNA-binding domain of Phe-tRNA-synthetase-like protein
MLCEELEELIEVVTEVAELGIFVAYTVAWCECDSHAVAADPFSDVLSELLKTASLKYSINTLKDNNVVRAYRHFYWRLGLDPTKIRPSSEALLRRLLKGFFPRLNLVVDAGNIASAETLVPIGLYDLRYLVPPLKLRFSEGGEIFKPIGDELEVLRRGIPILVDSRSVVIHLYPHRDCVDSMIREDTREVLVMGAGVPGVPARLVVRAVERVAELLSRVGWRWCSKSMIKPPKLAETT